MITLLPFCRYERYGYGFEVPCNQSKLSRWIVEWLGYQQTLAQPRVVHDLYQIPQEQLSGQRKNFSVSFAEEPFRLLCGSILYSEISYFGGGTDQELKQLMNQTGFKYAWIKSRDGHPIFNSAPPQPPRKRKLCSIALVLQFLCKFAGIEGRGAKEESIHRAEDRLGGPLPLPMV